MSYLGITHLIALKESLSTMCGLEKEVEKNHNVSLTAQAAVSLESLMQIGRKKNKSDTCWYLWIYVDDCNLLSFLVDVLDSFFSSSNLLCIRYLIRTIGHSLGFWIKIILVFVPAKGPKPYRQFCRVKSTYGVRAFLMIFLKFYNALWCKVWLENSITAWFLNWIPHLQSTSSNCWTALSKKGASNSTISVIDLGLPLFHYDKLSLGSPGLCD